ncbi:hypothetical protein J1N35_022686 [Gossypium stocksii]|uniref:Uncharacterized protein n=1 Tax=Gossypium stocksii TaxID=47602 RepID=A0A9D3VGH2_9ROSI|nr:hypothetical protein J1N35_022686 [Gossypium stocksii]
MQNRTRQSSSYSLKNKRGGRAQLLEISLPLLEFDHGMKGHALHAMEFALQMEKTANARLLHLHRVRLSCLSFL